MAGREFGTDPYGIISRGVPGGDAGSGVSFGSVGTSVPSLVSGAPSMGSGFGARFGSSFGGPSGNYKPETKAGVHPTNKNAKGGKVKKMAKGGSTASKRADGCATKGKTKGKFV